jgi:hypothetical protein
MLVLFGRGRDTKEIARSRTRKCPNCNNTVPFVLYELKDKVNIFFISVASYRTQYFLACSICNVGFELDDNDKEEFLRTEI